MSFPYGAMSNNMADHHRQNPSYPSPGHSYPSPQMPAYTYPPPQGQPGAEPYRSPQGGANMNLPPLNLPPIRVDGQQQQQQQQGPPMTSSLPPPQHGMPQYYAHPGHPPPGQPIQMGSQHLAMRYQLPPQAGDGGRMMSGGRHKKEIKRRTKTGCLTCRKRRIKCDEAHPVCRNCQKSKRECMGYDPIFKQQPGPANLQPAPNTTPQQPTVPATSPPASASSQYSPQVPQGYAPASNAGFAPAASTGSSTPSHHDNFNNAIDPQLASADPAMNGQPSYNGTHALQARLRGSPYAPIEAPVLKGRQLQIDEIFAIAGYYPPNVPPRNGSFSRELDDEFHLIFSKDYCLGLNSMLETDWFSTNDNAIKHVFSNQNLHEEAIFFAETMKIKTGAADVSQVFSQEARLIWHLLGTCRLPLNGAHDNGTIKVEHDQHNDLLLREARARFDILQALLTNQNLDTNPVRQMPFPSGLPEDKSDEWAFWDQLGEFVVHANTDAAIDGPAEMALTRMRGVLKMVETRDAIYSIAVARQVGNRVRGFPDAIPLPVDHDPEDDINKLTVAMHFVSHECRAGTQQVIARICDMACLSWKLSRSH
ncbi:hypothetical protein BU23DRAFT_85634 [Bimuria novae-zelandiae CBS 107.79]|uniref:Zn(2)-C6 fungal-type domain-containing protein n=1 Tax=Bimuria novae-zelandiae CBS 107.79 TaxID=1447943 RepID=A0A6A5VF45_9PLEO|nr:hypothetical protein BU23DRAFT_85634 [Bimuria novae-zelandiae CBS 107.79]